MISSNSIRKWPNCKLHEDNISNITVDNDEADKKSQKNINRMKGMPKNLSIASRKTLTTLIYFIISGKI